MKASEYREINPFFYNLEQITKASCTVEGIGYHSYLGSFIDCLLYGYIKNKKHFELVKSLDFKDEISTRAILNKANFGSKREEIEDAFKDFNASQEKLFSWLDNCDNPYFFILNPVYYYGWMYKEQKYGYKKARDTGSVNIDIAVDYANYRLKKQNKNDNKH